MNDDIDDYHEWYTLNYSCQDAQDPNTANHPRLPGNFQPDPSSKFRRDPRLKNSRQLSSLWRWSTFQSLSSSCQQLCSSRQAERRPLGPDNICLHSVLYNICIIKTDITKCLIHKCTNTQIQHINSTVMIHHVALLWKEECARITG